MYIDIIALHIIHEFLSCRALHKRDTGTTLIGAQIYVQNKATAYEVNNILVRRTIREILRNDGPLFFPSVSLPLHAWYREALVILIQIRIP